MGHKRITMTSKGQVKSVEDIEPKIISAEITDMPKNMFDPMPIVIATFEDGSVEEVFEYYPDEISFTPQEFKGLTMAQAKHLKFKKDRDYLRS